MATRFGAARPAHTYAARVRWLVGGLVTVILILVATLIFIAKAPLADEVATPDASASAQPAAVVATVKILVANQRIEVGASLMPYMFREEEVYSDRVPEGAWRSKEKGAIAGKFARNLINANLPLLREDVTDLRPISAVTGVIPPGYRAVTITVDSRTGVEGWAQPNTRVDVLWTYTDRSKQKKVATIVHFSKILSLGGNMSANKTASIKSTTVTLLVTEHDAKKIELARSTGTLSLSLVGEKETGSVSNTPEVVDITDLLPKPVDNADDEPASDGVLYTVDPTTGKQVKYLLRGRRWERGAQR